MDNLNFINNYIMPSSNEDIASVYISGNNAVMKNSNFKNHTSKGKTVVYALGENHNVFNCNFTNNNAVSLITPYGVVDRCNFINNKAEAVFWSQLGVYKPRDINKNVIKNTLFENNSGEYGVLVLSNENQCVINCTFTNNNALNFGGAIYSTSHNPYIVNNTFISNSAKKLGGAIYLVYPDAILSQNTFKNNAASNYNDVYGFFDFKLTTANIYCDEKVIIKVTDKFANKAVNGIPIYLEIYKSKYSKQVKAIIKNGAAVFDMTKVDAGSFNYEFLSNSEPYYTETGKITIKKAPTTIKAPSVKFKVKKSKYFKVTVKNKITKSPVKKGTVVKVKIAKKTYKLKTDKNGIVKFNTKSLKAGKYNVVITAGDSNYKISAKSKIIINK